MLNMGSNGSMDGRLMGCNNYNIHLFSTMVLLH